MEAAAAIALLVAFAVDRWLGEPPAGWHPVVWMGRALGAASRVAPGVGAAAPPVGASFAAGAVAWLLMAAAVVAVASGLQLALAQLPAWLAALAAGFALKPLLAWRMLADETTTVEDALARSLPAGRAQLARLVSRDVAALDADAVRESAIESLSENLNDSVVAPVFWFVVAGLPGAALYRFANTADAMWGYRGARDGRDWTWAGKFAARADDVLSWVPARLTALLLALARPGFAWRRLVAEAGRTPSPNSGWPMAAMALALGVRLRKPGVYTLNAPAPSPQAPHGARARELAGRAVAMLLVLAVAASMALARGAQA